MTFYSNTIWRIDINIRPNYPDLLEDTYMSWTAEFKASDTGWTLTQGDIQAMNQRVQDFVNHCSNFSVNGNERLTAVVTVLTSDDILPE